MPKRICFLFKVFLFHMFYVTMPKKHEQGETKETYEYYMTILSRITVSVGVWTIGTTFDSVVVDKWSTFVVNHIWNSNNQGWKQTLIAVVDENFNAWTGCDCPITSMF